MAAKIKSKNGLFLFVIGICVGTLTGLSVTPVIQTVLSSILGVVIAAVSVWVGLNQEEGGQTRHPARFDLNVAPLTLLVIGITLGAIGGILMRTHDILGDSRYQRKIEHQEQNAASHEKPKSSEREKNRADDPRQTGLYSTPEQVCDIINSFSGKQLIFMLKTIGDNNINAVIDSCNSDPALVKLKLIKRCKK